MEHPRFEGEDAWVVMRISETVVMIYLQRETPAKSSAIIGHVEEGEEKAPPPPPLPAISAINVACRKRANESSRTLLTRSDMCAKFGSSTAHAIPLQETNRDEEKIRLISFSSLHLRPSDARLCQLKVAAWIQGCICIFPVTIPACNPIGRSIFSSFLSS